MFYVYLHRRKSDGLVFYVGKGKGNRAFELSRRNPYWTRIKNKHGLIVELIEKNLSEKAAFNREMYWVAHFKKMNQAVANMTDGGDGVRVGKRWWGAAISNSLRGKPAKKGKLSGNFKHFADDQTLIAEYSRMGCPAIAKKHGVSSTTVWGRLRSIGANIRQVGSHKRPVTCTTDGITFESVSAAAKYYGVAHQNINKVLAGKYNHCAGKHFSR